MAINPWGTPGLGLADFLKQPGVNPWGSMGAPAAGAKGAWVAPTGSAGGDDLSPGYFGDPRQMQYNGTTINRAGDADVSKGDFAYKYAPDVGTYWDANDKANSRDFSDWLTNMPLYMGAAMMGGAGLMTGAGAGGAAAGGAIGEGAAAGGGALGSMSGALSGAGGSLASGATSALGGAGFGGLGVAGGVGGAAAGLEGAGAAGALGGTAAGAAEVPWGVNPIPGNTMPVPTSPPPAGTFPTTGPGLDFTPGITPQGVDPSMWQKFMDFKNQLPPTPPTGTGGGGGGNQMPAPTSPPPAGTFPDSGPGLDYTPGASQPGAGGAAAKTGSALSRVFDGTATTADYLSLAGSAGGSILGMLGSNAQGNAYKDVANQYLALGAPGRAQYDTLTAPGYDVKNLPGLQSSMDMSADVLGRKWSMQGNPALSPTAQKETQKYITGNVALPQYNTAVSQALTRGGLGVNQAGTGSLAGASTAGGGYDALGYGLSQATKEPTDWASLLKQAQFSLGNGKFLA